MNYLEFLLRWYNWPYLAALLIALASLGRLGPVGRLGARIGRWLHLERLSDHAVLRTFVLSVAVVGLTINGALHDYWPEAQETAFAPALALTLFLATVFTRAIGGVVKRHFPEIRAVQWGGAGLSGERGRVVSRLIGSDYRAGRVQVMGENHTLFMVLCKTRGEEIPYGAEVRLGEYDEGDGRYFVRPVEESEQEERAARRGPD